MANTKFMDEPDLRYYRIPFGNVDCNRGVGVRPFHRSKRWRSHRSQSERCTTMPNQRTGSEAEEEFM